MELLIEFTAGQKSPLQVIQQIVDALEVELKRCHIENYTVALILDSNNMEVEVLHTQGYRK